MCGDVTVGNHSVILPVFSIIRPSFNLCSSDSTVRMAFYNIEKSQIWAQVYQAVTVNMMACTVHAKGAHGMLRSKTTVKSCSATWASAGRITSDSLQVWLWIPFWSLSFQKLFVIAWYFATPLSIMWPPVGFRPMIYEAIRAGVPTNCKTTIPFSWSAEADFSLSEYPVEAGGNLDHHSNSGTWKGKGWVSFSPLYILGQRKEILWHA